MTSNQEKNERKILLPRVCAITDRGLAWGRGHEEIAGELIAGGARWIQVREKSLAPGEFLVQASAAVAVGRRVGALVVVNDRVDVAIAAGADGVHVGRDDLPAQLARGLLGDGAIVGVSTHSVEEGIGASRLPVDYVAIGPVFATTTKSDAEPVVGIEAVRALASAIAIPVVAIGGIDADNAREVLRAGACTVAVVSALYARGLTISENLARLLEAVED